jgi:hypothetical protein
VPSKCTITAAVKYTDEVASLNASGTVPQVAFPGIEIVAGAD